MMMPFSTTRLFTSARVLCAAFALLMSGAMLLPGPAQAQALSDAQRAEIETIIRNYLLKNPELLTEVSAELDRRQAAAESEKHKAALAQHTEAVFNSKYHVVLGNPKGSVTFVEFFDYNCGYCKRAMDDMLTLMKEDPNLRVVLKEFPVLGPQSVEAAQVALAVRMQDSDGKKYLAFHQKLLTGRGTADKARALAVAKEVGLDMARLEKDMAGPDIRKALEETFTVAQAMGLNGTPSYVIGKEVVIGAVGLKELREKVSLAKCGKVSCS